MAAAARRAEPRAGEWKFVVGEPPAQLTAYERPDRGGSVYFRVWTGERYAVKSQRLCGPIRREDGRIDPALETRARDLATTRQKATAADQAEVPADDAPLTLARGFQLLLDRRDGKYATDTLWKRNQKRYGAIIQQVLKKDTPWSEITHAHYRKLWRRMAEARRDKGRYGFRATELAVGALQTATRWLQQEGRIPPGSSLPAPRWKAAMRDDWVAITGEGVKEPAKPRYDDDELAALWRALPKADPRVALALEIGAELRLGQVPRSRRSDVEPYEGHEIGAVRVHGRGRKRGELVVLSMRERHVLQRAMLDGVLADLEAAYRDGRITDYYLIPGGKLRATDSRKGGKVRRAGVHRGAARPWGETGLRKAWRRLEQAAGVEYRKGRGWYGARRKLADLAEDVTSDERVLNRLGGWTNSATRRGYQEKGRAEVAEGTRHVRDRIRPRTGRGA